MPLFEVALLKVATEKELKDGKPAEELLYGPKAVVATDKDRAVMIALIGSGIPCSDPGELNLNQCKVLVRPYIWDVAVDYRPLHSHNLYDLVNPGTQQGESPKGD